MAVIVCYLDLQLPMQSMPITTDVVSSNLDQDELYNIIHLFTGYEDNSKFIVPRDTNYFPTRSEGK